MCETAISLNSIDKVKDFVSITRKFEAEMNLISGRYIISAKSIMGIFCMDLSKPMMLRVYEGKEKTEDIMDALSEYVKKREIGEGIGSIMSLPEEGI